MKKCITPGCENEADVKNRRLVCCTCKSKLYRRKNPIVSTYHSLKSKAKHRDIYFNLTLNEWERFCEDNNYIELRGKGSMDLTVDRNDPELGYIYSNLRALLNCENVRKGQIEKRKRKGWSKSFERDIGDPF